MAVMRGSSKSVHVEGASPDRDEVPSQPNHFHNASTAPDGGWTGFDGHDDELASLAKSSLSKSQFAGHKGLGIKR